MLDRLANLGPEFDHRLVHLRFDLLLEHDLAALENFLNVRAQFTRVRIDNRKLFLDAEGVDVIFHCYAMKLSENNPPVILSVSEGPRERLLWRCGVPRFRSG